MAFPYRVDQRVLALGRDSSGGDLMPARWDDEVLRLLGEEYLASQEELLGTRAPQDVWSDQVPLPMPNLVYLTINIIQREEQRSGKQVGPWKLFRLLAELQRLIEIEAIRRASNGPTCALTLEDLLTRARS